MTMTLERYTVNLIRVRRSRLDGAPVAISAFSNDLIANVELFADKDLKNKITLLEFDKGAQDKKIYLKINDDTLERIELAPAVGSKPAYSSKRNSLTIGQAAFKLIFGPNSVGPFSPGNCVKLTLLRMNIWDDLPPFTPYFPADRELRFNLEASRSGAQFFPLGACNTQGAAINTVSIPFLTRHVTFEVKLPSTSGPIEFFAKAPQLKGVPQASEDLSF